MVSTPVTVLVMAADSGLVLLLLAGTRYAARAQRQATGKREVVLYVGAGYLVAWYLLVVFAARGGVFETTPETAFPVIGMGIFPPILFGSILLAIPQFRERLQRIPLHWLVRIQVYRVVGGLFIVAWLQGDMPAQFALPAGIGDVLIGLAAPFVARKLAAEGPQRARNTVLVWCALGIADLVVAVSCGLLSAPSVLQQLALDSPNAAITSYPMVLVPTFAVPVSVLLHIYVIVRLRAVTRARALPARDLHHQGAGS